MARRRVGILISGRGSNMAALIEAAREPSFPADIVCVISNRPDAGGLSVARLAGIPTAIVEHTAYKDRTAFEHALHAELTARSVEFVCLAGFMRLLTPWFVTQWEGRMINIHPALLPAFKGLDTHQRALAAGVKLHGATVHFVSPDVDSGPIIAQGAVAVHDDDTPESLGARVIAVEHRLYPQALRLVADGRVRIDGDRCRISGAPACNATLIAPAID